MRKLVLIVHTSLDGFVARTNGELTGFSSGEENLEAVCRLTKSADAALFGRKSFQLLHQYWPTACDQPQATWNEFAYSNWYNGAQKFVVSSTLQEQEAKGVCILRSAISSQIISIKESAGRDILLFGSPTLAHTLMQCNLIDEYWIFINPVLFGEGIPLFRSSSATKQLALNDVQQFSNGEIALQYCTKTC